MKKLALIILLFSFFACKTKRIDTSINESKQTDISLVESRQKETSSEVSGSLTVTAAGNTERNTRQNGGGVWLAAPDSAGKQYPIFVYWYGNEIAEKTAENTNINADYSVKITELEKEISDLKSQISEKSKEKTVSKTEILPLWKKIICFIPLSILLVFGIYRVFKWWLKK